VPFARKLEELAFNPTFTFIAGATSILGFLGWLYDEYASASEGATTKGIVFLIIAGIGALVLLALTDIHLECCATTHHLRMHQEYPFN
jgi:hypothetical protein